MPHVKTFNKIVRDKMEGIILDDNNMPLITHVHGNQLHFMLACKAAEEAEEYKQIQSVEELADLYEVVLALARYHGGISVVEDIANKKREERGAFNDGVFLVAVRINDK